MKRDNEAIKRELAALADDGVIRAADVVAAARDEASALHPCFEWDDSEAAEQYRLVQARALLRVYVEVSAPDSSPTPVFVSLTSDRVKEGGGYRALADVMSNDDMRAQLLADAFRQFASMRQKYQHLKQLAGVWDAVDEAEMKQSKQPRRKRGTEDRPNAA